MDENENQLVVLAKLGKRIRPETELDRFQKYIEGGAVITQAHAIGVCAEDNESERWYKPADGLTEDVYSIATNDDERSILARAILEGELVRRGHDYRGVRTALDQYDQDDLRDLVDTHSFGAVADALEVTVRAVCKERPRNGPNASNRGSIRNEHPLTPAEMELERRLAELEKRFEAVHGRMGNETGRGSGPPHASPYLGAEQAAAYLGISVKALYGLTERGRLKSLPASRRLRFTREMLDEFMRGTSR